LYVESAELKSPGCDQFVISISPHDHMSLACTFAGGQTGANDMFGVIAYRGFAAGRQHGIGG
jgi:hypothetical protein